MGCQTSKTCFEGEEVNVEIKKEKQHPSDPLEDAKRIIRENVRPTGTRIVLISDNLPAYEVLLRAVLDDVVVVPVQYGCWDLPRLKMEIMSRAGLPEKQFDSVGFLDHGLPGEFCLLKSVAGGTIDMGDFKNATDSSLLVDFFKYIASYVKQPKDLQHWRKDLDCRIDLMACDVAKDAAGLELITHLENITGVNWAASSNKTGAGEGVENGYDWVLETEEGLGSVAGAYFEEDKLIKWKHQASALWTVGSTLVTFVPGGNAVVNVAGAISDVAYAEDWTDAAGKVAWRAGDVATGGSLSLANEAYNIGGDVCNGDVGNIAYKLGDRYSGGKLSQANTALSVARDCRDGNY